MKTLSVTFEKNQQDINGAVVDGLESVRQRVTERLRFRVKTWFLNLRDGVPYTPNVFGHKTTEGLAARTLTDAIRGVADVTDVTDVQTSLNPETREFTYQARVHTIYGLMQTSETVTT